VAQVYGRDALNRMSRRDLTENGTNFSYEVYSYDSMSRLTHIDRGGTDDDAFTYYQDSELKTATYGSTAVNDVTYNLDKAGNRTSIVDGGVSKSYAPNILNQYTSAEGAAVTNGSEHEIAGYAGVTYDHLNDGQLVSATATGKTYNLAYDALGRCVKRTYNNAITYYIYDGEKPILEYNGTGALIGWNLYGKGIDEILMRGYLPNTTWVSYLCQQDHEGSVTHLLDFSGNVIESYKYNAFGKPVIYNAAGAVISASAYSNRFMFTGREWAQGSLGFYEYRARAYHPGLGRFLSEDPKGFDAGDYNLFRYCGNDPVDRSDPTGLFGISSEQSYSGMVDINSGYSDGITGTNGARVAAGGSDLAQQYGPRDASSNGWGVANVTMAGEWKNGSGTATTYSTARAAADSRADAVASRTQDGMKEFWAPFGYDSKTKRWAAGSIFPGDGVGRVKDKYNDGATDVQKSTITRGDLPKQYAWRGYVLGHVNYDTRYVNDDFRRAKDAHLSALIILPPVTGQASDELLL
jgi:RHS repeat-associated protein